MSKLRDVLAKFVAETQAVPCRCGGRFSSARYSAISHQAVDGWPAATQKVEVKTGDRVLFVANATHEFDIEDEKYLVIGQEQVLAIIR